MPRELPISERLLKCSAEIVKKPGISQITRVGKMKILIDIVMDGYETEAEEIAACRTTLEDYLDSAAITVKVLWDESQPVKDLLAKMGHFPLY